MSDEVRRIDWQEVNARLCPSRGGSDTTSDHRTTVYRQRALELAAPRGLAEEDAGTVPVLVFSLNGERFGLELADLGGVLPLERYTLVPGSPAELLGVINYRGRICSLLDLARLLGLLPTPSEAQSASEVRSAVSYVLILRRAGREVGFKVGPVEGLLRIVPGAGAVPGESAGPVGPYLKALTPDRLRLLSADAILSHPLFTEVSRE